MYERFLGCSWNFDVWMFNLDAGVPARNRGGVMRNETAEQMKERIRNELAQLAYRNIIRQWFRDGEYGYGRIFSR
jgi:hypothetical protein